MNDTMTMFKLLKILIFYLKELLKQLIMKKRYQKERFLGMLLVTFGASLLGNILTGKGILRAGYGTKEGKWIASYGSKKNYKIPPHPLTNIEIRKYHHNESRFSGVYPRNNLPRK